MVDAATLCVRVVTAIVVLMATVTGHEALAERLEQCIGRFCVGPRAKTYEVWASSLGSRTGAAVPGEDARRTLCIRDHRSKAYLILGFSGDGPIRYSKLDSLFLTTQAVCDRDGTRTFQNANTERGLKLGSSRHDIAHLLGSPARIDDAVEREIKDHRYQGSLYGSRFGRQRLHYQQLPDSLLFNQFGMDAEGRVVSIWISDSP